MTFKGKEKFVYEAIAELSARLGMPAPEVVFHNTPEYNIGRAHGRCFTSSHTIGVRISGRNRRYIRHTVAHELIHMRFPKLYHGVRFEQYTDALLDGFMAFGGNGLITKVKKPAPGVPEEISRLLTRQKKIDTKIKRLTTAKRKILRRLNFLKRKELVEQLNTPRPNELTICIVCGKRMKNQDDPGHEGCKASLKKVNRAIREAAKQ